MFFGEPILIVEDECFVALALADAVEDLNGRVVGPVATVAAAFGLLDAEAIAAAVLDARLADRDVTPFAMRLAETQVPFVLHTGTGVPVELAASLPNLAVVMKPVRPLIVLTCLMNEMTKHRSQDEKLRYPVKL